MSWNWFQDIHCRPLMLTWISSFLRNRVKLDSINSNPFHCCSGVPQGSHLGPLLFIMFINDITSVLSYSQCLLYADDLKLFLSISSINDCIKLQSDIDALSIWCKVNCLHLNIAKCNVTTFSRSSNPIIHRYSIDSLYLTRVNKVKDLGVVFDQALTFCDHVDYITSKANSMVGFIKRNTVEFSNPHSLITLFSALARSLLEYCDIVWCPFYQVHIDRVERVQRRFSKFVFFKMRWNFSPDYEARCQLLGLVKLTTRRKIHDVMFVRDVLCYHLKSPCLLALIPIYAPERPLRQREFLFRALHRTNYGLNEPMSRAISNFNSVWSVVDLSSSRSIFKSTLFNFYCLIE